MKKFIYILIIASLLSIFLASCNFPIDISQQNPDQQDMRAVEITLEPSNTPPPTPRPTPVCLDLNPFGWPFEHWPSHYEISSVNPTFTWFYSGGTRDFDIDTIEDWANICVPEYYTIVLSTGPDFTDEITLTVPIEDMTVTADTGKLTMTWTSNEKLEPLKTYRWFVVGHFNDLLIHDYRINFLHSLTWNYQSDYYKNVFRTNPECPSGGLSIPQLMEPADGAVIHTLHPIMSWDVVGCMPLVFLIQFSTLPTFENMISGLVAPAAGDFSIQLQTNYPWWNVNYQLRDCTTFYWRVQSGIGDPGWAEEREWGDWSDIHSFYVSSSYCPTPAPTATKTQVPTKTPTRTPTPTAPPEPVSVDCGSISDATSCNNNSACQWIPNVSCPTCGSCVNK